MKREHGMSQLVELLAKIDDASARDAVFTLWTTAFGAHWILTENRTGDDADSFKRDHAIRFLSKNLEPLL